MSGPAGFETCREATLEEQVDQMLLMVEDGVLRIETVGEPGTDAWRARIVPTGKRPPEPTP
jgi:hypothetical protein